MEVVMSYLQKHVFRKKAKDIIDKIFDIITN